MGRLPHAGVNRSGSPRSAPPEPEWWLERYVERAREVEDGTEYTPRGGAFVGWRGPLSRFVQEKVTSAHRAGLSVVDACDLWHSGAYLLETVPCVLYILMRHGRDPEEAIVRAVNDTNDNDTVAAIVGAAVGALHTEFYHTQTAEDRAAIVGAAVGALHGIDALPKRWREGLLGRTGVDNAGRADKILKDARATWRAAR